jgi:hypothetical protein
MNGEVSFSQFAGQAAAPPPASASGTPEVPFQAFAAPQAAPSYPMVPPHLAPDGSGTINMSDSDWLRFKAGLPPQTAGTTPQAAPPPASAPPPKQTGIVANIGAGTGEAASGFLGAPVDWATGAFNALSRAGNQQLQDAVARATGAPASIPPAPQITNPVGGSQWLDKAFGYVGGNPNNVAVGDGTDQIARAAGRGIGSMLLPWSFARALPVMSGIPGALQQAFGAGGAPTMAAAGGVGGAAGQVAENAVPAPYKPLANMAGNMLGGGSVIGTVAATKAALDAAAPLVSNYVAPFTAAGRQQIAGQRIASAASDLNAVHDTLNTVGAANQQAASLQAVLNDPNANSLAKAMAQRQLTALGPQRGMLVPDSQPTTAQLTGDQGLLNLERVAATPNPDAFLGRMGAQNTARVDALSSLAPETASPSAVGDAFRQRLADMDTAAETQVAGLRQAAQGATDALGGAVPVGSDAQTSALQGYGQRLRGGLDAANQAARAQTSRLYSQVDPDGTLAVDMTGIRQAARGIATSIPKNAAPVAGEPAAILGTAQMLPKVQPFGEVAALRSRITDAMRAELYENGRSQTYARLAKLLGAVDDTLSGGVEQRAGEDAAAVAAGTKAPEGTMLARLQQRGSNGAPPVGTTAAGSSASVSGQPAGTGTAGGLGAGGDGVTSPRRYGTAGGNRAMAAASAASRLRKPESLVDFLISRGGVQDQGGDLRAIGAETVHHQMGGRLVNPRGVPLDYAREAAEEEGFLRPGSTTADLLNSIAEEVSGRPVYRQSEQAEGDAWAQAQRDADRHEAAWQAARSGVQMANIGGPRLSPAEMEHAAELVTQGMEPHQALQEAARAGEETVLDRNAAANAFGHSGVPLAARQAHMDVDGASPLAPNFDAEAAARYRAANASHRGRVATFEEAPGVGQVLATGKHAGEWRLGDSQVAATIFNSGKGAAERVQAFMRAGGNSAALVSDLKDYAAFSLRRAAEDGDGTLDPGKAAKWIKAHDEALSAFPEVKAAFNDAVSARVTMDDAAARHVAARQAFEKSAAAKFLGDADPVMAVGRILRSDNAAATMAELARHTANAPAARAGLQRAVIDYMLSELRSNAQAGAERAMKADVFQTFARRATPALREIFSPDQVDAIRKVAADLQRSQRSSIGSKLPGGSNTAQDLAAGAKHGHGGPSTIGLLVAAETAGEALQHVVGPVGRVFGMVATAMGNAMRQAGLHTVNDLVAEAMLHPELARTLLAKVPNVPAARFVGQAAGRQLRALAMQSAVDANRREPAPLPSRFNALATPSTAPAVSARMQ